jgi:rare lipoprotein A
MRPDVAIAALILAACVSGCATRVPPPAPGGKPPGVLEVREGLATYYGKAFQGRITASGRPFDMNALVAAHPSYPFGTRLRVTNLANGRQVTVQILDRGPARRSRASGVIIDLSQRAAEVLEFTRQGRARVRLEVLEWGKR